MTKLPDWAERGRLGWTNTGARRPAFAEDAGPGQESVWDYPRPPRLVSDSRRVIVRLGATVIADTNAALRLLETSHPPSFYLPPEDIDARYLVVAGGGSRCEWKGSAHYWDVLVDGRRVAGAGWSYPAPFDYRELAAHVAFYAAKLECFVDGERVEPQPGRFYGGWITGELVGPFKGSPGSSGW